MPSAVAPPFTPGAWTFNTDVTDASAGFGRAVSLSSDGLTLVVSQRPACSGARQYSPFHHPPFPCPENRWEHLRSVAVLARPLSTLGHRRRRPGPWRSLNTGFSSNDNFGRTVSVSGDGATVAIGAFGYNSYAGGVFVYIRSGNTWSGTPTGTLLTPSAPYVVTSGNSLGGSVSISTDGLTIAG